MGLKALFSYSCKVNLLSLPQHCKSPFSFVHSVDSAILIMGGVPLLSTLFKLVQNVYNTDIVTYLFVQSCGYGKQRLTFSGSPGHYQIHIPNCQASDELYSVGWVIEQRSKILEISQEDRGRCRLPSSKNDQAN